MEVNYPKPVGNSLPLSFVEYLSDSKLGKNESLKEYIRYGGIIILVVLTMGVQMI